MNVRKYNGELQPLNPHKIAGWLLYTGIPAVDELVSTVVENAYEGIKTSDIQLQLTNLCTMRALTASEMKDYQKAELFLEAARILYLTVVHKTAAKLLGEKTIQFNCVADLLPVVEFGVAEGIYDKTLLDFMHKVGQEQLQTWPIYHNRDNLLPACGLDQLDKKYFRKVKYGNDLVYSETPTIMYALMALAAVTPLCAKPLRGSAEALGTAGFGTEALDTEAVGTTDTEAGDTTDTELVTDSLDLDTLRQDFIDIYEGISQGRINCPTPVTIGLRTPQRDYASCVLAEVPDTMAGIDAAYDVVSKATAARAGLGMQVSAIRPMLAPVKSGSLEHTGLVKFIQAWMKITKATVQNSARGGSATFNIAYWHRNFFDLVMLNDPDGEDSVRCKEADYVFHHDGYLLETALKDGYIALLDPNTKMTTKVGTMSAYETYYSDIDSFYSWVEQNVNGLPHIDVANPYENCKVKAYEVLSRLAKQIFKTGNNYQLFTDNVNSHTPYEEPIKMTNLCVAPDTLIMIKDVGQVPISSVAGTTQKVWNGFNWTEVDIVKTGTNQKMVRVTTYYGKTLVCTPYHNFYLVKHTDNAKRYFGKPSGHTKVTASELYPGAKLMKGALPTDNVSIGIRLPMAYDNGFFSGDGTTTDRGRSKIYLYGEKANLASLFASVPKWHEDCKKLYGFAVGLRAKFYVPEDSVLLEDKLNWLAGVLDADGTVARQGGSYAIQLTNTNLLFLNKIVAMLEFIGIHSKISLNRPEGDYKLPDGNGGLATYHCSAVYRLLIAHVHTAKLIELGLTTYRLNFSGMSKPSRDASRFDTVVTVEPLEELMDTYCFKDHTLGLGMFNGIVTGNCVEVLEPTHPIEVNDPFSEVALCTLGGIPWGIIEDADIPQTVRGQLKLLKALFEQSAQKIPFTEAAKLRRSVGIGAIDVHHYLAKFNLDLTDGSYANLKKVGELVHNRMELIQYHLIREAATLARKFGPADYRTKWKKGWLPIDTYKKHDLNTYPLKMGWEELRQYVIDSGGLYFSALSAHMPSESSSVIWGFINGFEPPRQLITDKSSKVLSVLVPVPEMSKLQYTLAYDVHPDVQLVIAANIQKFSCQGMSFNKYVDYTKTPSLPMSKVMEDFFYKPHALGLKTMYYVNFNVDNEGDRIEIVDSKDQQGCAGGACTL